MRTTIVIIPSTNPYPPILPTHSHTPASAHAPLRSLIFTHKDTYNPYAATSSTASSASTGFSVTGANFISVSALMQRTHVPG